MFEGLKKRRLAQILGIKQTELAIKYIEQLEAETLKSLDSLKDSDEDQWIELGASSEKELSEADSTTLRQQATKFYYKEPHARNIIRLIEKYVVGRGFQISPMSTLEAVADVWKEFWKHNKMDLRKKEIVRRTMRDGEIFIRYFDDNGMMAVRFMNPDKVNDPDKDTGVIGSCTYGIETDKDDIENVLAYWYKGGRIPAEEVDHYKILVDFDVKRGRSFIEIIAPLVKMYNDWLKDRMKLNKVRSAVGLVKSVAGTPTQAANIATADRIKTTKQLAPDKTAYHRAPEGVSVFTSNKGVEYKMLSPNLQASDVHYDGRAILLAIATGVGFSECMISADSSNSNYASSLIAEGPAVMEIEDWQDYFSIIFEGIFERVIKHAIAKGKLPTHEIYKKKVPKEENGITITVEEEVKEPVSTECNIVFPEIVARDIKKLCEALVLQRNEGWISDHTASADLDRDYEAEQELIRQEEENETGGEEPLPEDKEDEAFRKAAEKGLDEE